MVSSSSTLFSYNEFIAFILLYAGHEDLDFDKTEEEFIIDLVGKACFEQINSVFNRTGHFEALQIILKHRELHFPNEEKKNELLAILKKSFYADGEFSKLEKNLFNFFSHLL